MYLTPIGFMELFDKSLKLKFLDAAVTNKLPSLTNTSL